MSSQAAQITRGAKPIPLLLTLALGASIWFFPPPEGLDLKAWHLFAIFTATIFGIILKTLPMGGMALLALTFLSTTHTLTLKETLSGFSHSVIWLVVFAFFIAKSFVKTGLGIRIAYHFVSIFGKKSLGLAYGIAVTDLAFSL